MAGFRGWVALALGCLAPPVASQTLLWQQRFDAGALADADATSCTGNSSLTSGRCVALDAAGNTYLAGSAWNGADDDYLLLRYSPTGQQQWALVYDSGRSDSAQRLALAPDGSAYVAGVARTAGGADERLHLVKYDAGGVRQWVAVGAAPRPYRVMGLGVDAAGGVYVGLDTLNFPKMRLVKYQPDGSQAWERLFPEDDSQASTWALTVDPAGYAYLGGVTTGSAVPTEHHIVTVKYDAAGTRLWAATEATGSEAYPSELAFDAAGGVYVAGRTRLSSFEMLTLKYDAAGVQQWARTFGGVGDDRAWALAVDSSASRVYVTGQASNLAHTIAYDLAGNEQWARDQAAPGFLASGGVSTAVDASGDVTVAVFGEGMGSADDGWLAVKYSPAGDQRWLHAPGTPVGGRPASLAVLAGGDVAITGWARAATTDLRTERLAGADGATLWTRSEPPLGHGNDVPCGLDEHTLIYRDGPFARRCLAVDAAQNAYVAVRSWNGASDDIVTRKYAPNGALLWSRSFDSGAADAPYALALDAAGNVFVAGRSGGNLRVLRYTGAGTPVFSATYPGGSNGRAYAVAGDATGGAYVTGQTGGTSVAIVTVAFDAVGAQRWVAPAQGGGWGVAVAAVPGGGVQSLATLSPGGFPSMATVRYSASGAVLWQRTLSSVQWSYAEALAVGSSGEVYVAGGADNNNDENEYLDFRTVKFDSAGTQLWSQTYGGVYSDEHAVALALDAAGNVYVAGSVAASFPATHAWLAASYSPSGAQRWVATVPTSGGHDYAQALGHDGGASVYVAGWVDTAGGTRDVRVTRHDAASGVQLWSHVVDASGADAGQSLALAGASVWVAAESKGLATDALLLRYDTDSLPPQPPASLTSSSHAPGGWSNQANILALWSGAADEPGGSGLGGYSLAFDASASTLPDAVVDVAHVADPHGAPSPPLGEGWRYAHVRACDLAHNCSGAIHAGPFGIDLTPPVAPAGLSSPSHGIGVASNDTTVELDWVPSSDTLSGPSGQAAWFDWSAAGTCPQSATLRVGTAHVASQPLAAGSWYAHACARDNAGNASSVSSLGPFVINAVADLALAASASRDPAPRHGEVVYRLEVANLGPSDAGLVTLVGTLSPELVVLEVQPSAECTLAGASLACALGRLAAGKQTLVSVRARADDAGTFGVQAQVALASGELDPNAANDQAQAATLFRVIDGDLDQDGQADLLWRHAPSGAYSAWLMNGTLLREARALEPAQASGPPWRLQVMGDFDGDGRNDLAFHDASSGAVEFWLMNGTSRVGAPVPIGNAAPLPAPWRLAVAADFDHDGHPDLLWRNDATQALLAWTMNGTAKLGELVPSPAAAPDAGWQLVAATDCDGDGNADLVFWNAVSGRVVQWLMDASLHRLSGRFTNPPGAGDAHWQAQAAVELGPAPGGAPGVPDLLWRHALSGRLVVWRLDAAAQRIDSLYTTPPAPPDPPSDWALVGPR